MALSCAYRSSPHYHLGQPFQFSRTKRATIILSIRIQAHPHLPTTGSFLKHPSPIRCREHTVQMDRFSGYYSFAKTIPVLQMSRFRYSGSFPSKLSSSVSTWDAAEWVVELDWHGGMQTGSAQAGTQPTMHTAHIRAAYDQLAV